MAAQTKQRIKKGLLILLFIAILLTIPPVANGVATVAGAALGWSAEKVKEAGVKIREVSQKSIAVIGGAFLIVVGAITGVAVLSIALVVIGIAAIAWGLWDVFKPSPKKPDNVKIDIYD